MAKITATTLTVGAAAGARTIAIQTRSGAGPGLFWLGGFRSEMVGTKAMALDAFGAKNELAVTRFDYSGHGQSGGDFLEGTISRWLEEALAVFATTSGPQILVGSSMGGWLALLVNRALRLAGTPRVKALLLIAPATDMTADLMRANFTPQEARALAETGLVEQTSQYSEVPDPITRALIEDGDSHRLFGSPIDTGCPVTILQGGRDPDVPPAHALKLVAHLLTDPVTFTLVPDGDHRLSRPQDLTLLEAALAREIDS